jgi:glycosyltransferase involved in cell wall biosynthesis
MPTVSYAITACNEHEELERLLFLLDLHIQEEDEIVVQLDTSATDEVRKVLENFTIKVIEFPLNNDFASFKNNLSQHCDRDYIFQIDADEFPKIELLQNLPAILENNFDTDVFLVPRINTVEGLTPEHIQKWGWRVENGRVNFPDYQWRIWKNNGNITWKNKVHEVLQGYNSLTDFPPIDELCLVHPKTIIRQEKQNEYYNTL